MTYNHREIESKWQSHWVQKSIFKTLERQNRPKFYALDMFPYPSASGLHVGHPLGYVATDITARYYRMKGYNVLHPMGWDAFGLPAEQHAIETQEHPSLLTNRSIENFKRQLNNLGLSYDWSREVSTCDPKYYHWTQWIFTHLFKKGLAYQEQVFVNWCPALKTVLANEEIVDGKSERGGHDVFRVPMKQWMLKITAYAERLLQDLDSLDWPESTKDIQRNWIGKSEGAKIIFAISGHSGSSIEVFTTRQDTLFGATYLVLAPEHPLVSKITTADNHTAVQAYKGAVSRKSDLDRTQLNKDKSGVFTGAYAIHPASGEQIPIWIGDYVLYGYGTGAIMAVPGHDERDHAFALKYNLPIVDANSPFLDGLSVEDAKEKMTTYLQNKGCGEKSINYKLRDWVFSRQRYWGEPIPILKDSLGKVIRPLRDDELPLTLPEVKSYEPSADGKSPLSRVTTWVQRSTAQGEMEFVETDTMPGSAGSSWYFMRYCDPFSNSCFASYEKLSFWLPVDLYIGGQEHAVGHLLYSRFWTKVLYDAGLCPVTEPFQKLVHQGMICKNGAKMSKSKGNGVSPDEVIVQYGADSLRVYEMFMGPLSQTKEWDESNLAGVRRFLGRIEAFYVSETGESLVKKDAPTPLPCLKMLHKTVKKVTEDIESLSFNTSIAQMMILLNTLVENKCRSQEICASFLKVLAPFAPHLAEELWHKCILEQKISPETSESYPYISLAEWPTYDAELLLENEVTIGVQVNGKHRGEITIFMNSSQEVAVETALKHENIKNTLEGKSIVKTIFVPNRILNFVVR